MVTISCRWSIKWTPGLSLAPETEGGALHPGPQAALLSARPLRLFLP